jgi:replication fork clamp-binding protein CrfC
VPLILRLQSCKSKDESIIRMDYGTVKDHLIHGEEKIEAAINAATGVLAGVHKAVRDTPISLHIRKPHVPDLTMVDLPGITRVPVHGQPANIYKQIQAMIMHYISPEESIILNVLSAQVDFPTCESIRMLQQVDNEGKRTLAVVMKVDKAPEGLLEKVTTDAVNIGLGYVCVRNRTHNDDTISVARVREKDLFESHPTLKD